MSSQPVAAPVPPLTPTQIATLALYGAVLWFIAAMIVRSLAPMDAHSGGTRALIYALVLPGTVPVVLIGQRLARLARAQTGAGIAVVTAAAALLDGIALAWFPALYGSGAGHVLAGAAVILWGAGVGLALGVAMSRPAAG